MITNFEKKKLIKEFPKIVIKNEKQIYNNFLKKTNNLKNKIVYMLVPKGIKSFIWFTYIDNKNICLLIKINNNEYEIEPFYLSFSDELSYGTILYGTFLTNNNNKFFVCEDIYYYKNKDISDYDYNKKLKLMYNIFNTKISQKIYTTNSIIILTAIINLNYSSLYNIIDFLSYKVYSIKFIDIYKNNIVGIEKYKEKNNLQVIFKVKAGIQQDVYYLYCLDNNNNEIYYNIAHIPSYKKSIYMNNLFRKIKENSNLDLLEESDSDSDFENTNEAKYVNLNITYNMICIYNKNNMKWEPNKIVNNNNIVKLYDINKIKKNL